MDRTKQDIERVVIEVEQDIAWHPRQAWLKKVEEEDLRTWALSENAQPDPYCPPPTKRYVPIHRKIIGIIYVS